MRLAVLFFLAAIVAAPCWAADQVVLPSPGKAVGVVRTDTPGTWAVLSQDFLPAQVTQFEGDETTGWHGCFFEGAAGRYAVIKSEKGALKIYVVNLGGANPAPVPIPVPGPTPGPSPVVLPQGKYGLAKLAYDSISKVPDSSRGSFVVRLAENYEATAASVRAQMAAGVVPKVADVLDGLRRKNRVTLGADQATGVGGHIEPWRPWFVAWQAHTDPLGAAGTRTLITAEDYAAAFSETAIGLRAYHQ